MLTGTVTNDTNSSIELYAVQLTVTYPASESKWDSAPGFQADVNNEYGFIPAGNTQTWSVYDTAESNGSPVSPTTVTGTGFMATATGPAYPLDQACEAQGTGSAP